MLEKFIRTCSATDVNAETDRQERLKLLAKFLRLLQSRCTVGSNEVESLERFLIEVGWLRLDHLNGHDTKRPDINLWTIFFLLNDFRSHPVRSSDHGGTLGFTLSKFGTESKISYTGLGLSVNMHGEYNLSAY
jgi:hypothetical protein